MTTGIQFPGMPYPSRSRAAMLGVAGHRETFRVRIANGFVSRMAGWMGRSRPPGGMGLWLAPCDAVHTLFMRFAIDIVFLDAAGRVLVVDRSVPAWRIRVCFGAQSVIELPAGKAASLGIAPGVFLNMRAA